MQQHYYFNTGRHGIAIVAKATIFDEEPFDWAAYIGADNPEHEEDAVREAVQYGNKLCEWMARALFPDFADIPYRA